MTAQIPPQIRFVGAYMDVAGSNRVDATLKDAD